MQPIENLGRRDLLTFIIDSIQPDGTPAAREARDYAAQVLRKRDEGLWEAVLIAYAGQYADGSPIDDWSVKNKAHEGIDAARLDRAESWKEPRTGEIAFATGDPRSADERLVVRTPASTRKVSNGERARMLLEEECAKRSLALAEIAAPFRPGKPSDEDRMRRARLAIVVAKVRASGVTLEAIGEAVDMPKQRRARRRA